MNYEFVRHLFGIASSREDATLNKDVFVYWVRGRPVRIFKERTGRPRTQ